MSDFCAKNNVHLCPNVLIPFLSVLFYWEGIEDDSWMLPSHRRPKVIPTVFSFSVKLLCFPSRPVRFLFVWGEKTLNTACSNGVSLHSCCVSETFLEIRAPDYVTLLLPEAVFPTILLLRTPSLLIMIYMIFLQDIDHLNLDPSDLTPVTLSGIDTAQTKATEMHRL